MEGRRQMAQRLSIDSALADSKKIPEGLVAFIESSQEAMTQGEAVTTFAGSGALQDFSQTTQVRR
jgi:hypothetical protein